MFTATSDGTVPQHSGYWSGITQVVRVRKQPWKQISNIWWLRKK